MTTILRSPAERLAALPKAEREHIINSVPGNQMEALQWDWRFWARPKQLQPLPNSGHICENPRCQETLTNWLVWFYNAGRGAGKTRAGAEALREEIENNRSGRIALVSRTPADARDVMVEGSSGILAVFPAGIRPVYEPSKRRLTFHNGASATIFTSYEPDMLRGPQFDWVWCDELAAFFYPQETWDNLMLGLRLGTWPRVVVTSTPKPIKLIRELLVQPNVHVTRGTTYENRANLAAAFYSQIVSRYEGTRLARQELYGDILDEMPGALWTRANIRYQAALELSRVIVAIDPAGSASSESDETGIIVAGKAGDRYYVLEDYSGRYSPDGWGRKAVVAADVHKADRVVAETNFGGQMVEHVLRTIDPHLPFKAVTASRGKAVRAEPIAALYEQGKVFHVKPLPTLEDQLVTWTPDSSESPDRLDALVFALTELTGGKAWTAV